MIFELNNAIMEESIIYICRVSIIWRPTKFEIMWFARFNVFLILYYKIFFVLDIFFYLNILKLFKNITKINLIYFLNKIHFYKPSKIKNDHTSEQPFS